MLLDAWAGVIHLDQPWWLAGAAAAIVPIALGAWHGRRGRIRRASTLLQCLAVTAAALTLAQPLAFRSTKGQRPWLVLRDVSASTRGQDASISTPRGVASRTVDFADGLVANGCELRVAGCGTSRTVDSADGLVEGRNAPGDSTRVAPALLLAAARSGELGGVAVVTDGQFDDDWKPAAEALGRTGLPVRVVPLASPPPDARIIALSARFRPAGAVDLRVTVAANAPQRRTLTVWRQEAWAWEAYPLVPSNAKGEPENPSPSGRGAVSERSESNRGEGTLPAPLRFAVAYPLQGHGAAEGEAGSQPIGPTSVPSPALRSRSVPPLPQGEEFPPPTSVDSASSPAKDERDNPSPPGRGPRVAGGEGERIFSRKLDLLAGEDAAFHLQDRPPGGPARCVTYWAGLDPGDMFPENDRVSTVAVPARWAIAVVGDGADAADVAASLRGNGGSSRSIAPAAGEGEGKESPVFDVQVLSAAEAPAKAADWINYRCAVLVDGDGRLLSAPRRAALAQYVRNGGGLVLIGSGPRGGGEKRDRDDPLNQVAALAPNADQRRPLKVTVVLDASGSMGEKAGGEEGLHGRLKFDLAAEAVESLESHLTPRDALSVITFSDSATWVYDSGRGAPDGAQLGRALAAVRPGGPTVAGGALQEAAAAPVGEGMEGLVIVVSDLDTQPFDTAPIAEAMRRRKLAFSVVAIEGAADSRVPPSGPIQRLAGELGTKIVRNDRLEGLADVLLQFVRQRRGPDVRRGDFLVRFAPEVFALRTPAIDRLGGYILAAAVGGAQELAWAGDDPVLARRTVGLGRSVTLAAPWEFLSALSALSTFYTKTPGGRGEEKVGKLLLAAAAWAAQGTGDMRYSAVMQDRAGGSHITVEAYDGNAPMNLLGLVAAFAGGSPHAERETELLQTAPGRYEALLAGASEGSAVAVRGRDGQAVWLGGLGHWYSREFARVGPNWDNLRELARLTGGRVVEGGALEAAVREIRDRSAIALWPATLAMALAAMLVEWCRRSKDAKRRAR